jgi:hypothetical protein
MGTILRMLTALAPPRLRQDSVLALVASWIVAKAPGAGRWLAKAVRRGRTLVLQTAGLGAVTLAAWDVARPLGLLAAGASLLLLEGFTGPSPDDGARR